MINKTRTHNLNYSDDIDEVGKLTATLDVAPVLPVSCVTGSGIALMKDFFFTLIATSMPHNFSTLRANSRLDASSKYLTHGKD